MSRQAGNFHAVATLTLVVLFGVGAGDAGAKKPAKVKKGSALRLPRADRSLLGLMTREDRLRSALEASPPDFEQARSEIDQLPPAPAMKWGIIIRTLTDRDRPDRVAALWKQTCALIGKNQTLLDAIETGRLYLKRRHSIEAASCAYR